MATHDTAGTLGETRSKADMLADRGERIGKKIDELEQSARGFVTKGKESVQRWSDGMSDRIQEKPMQSLAIALGVGVVLGLLLSRRS